MCKIYRVHQTPVVILCLAGYSELNTHKKQVISHANFVLRRRSNLIGVAKERRLGHRHRESGAKQFKDCPKFVLKLASRPKPPPLSIIMTLIFKNSLEVFP